MELKRYQSQVIGDLEDYLKALDGAISLKTAWSTYWQGKGFMPPRGYYDDIAGAANVCIKVPTGGGKTFIAACALKNIFDHSPTGKTRFVVWLVPSDAILSQTVANLSNSSHPYRQRINKDFGGRVNVYTKEQLLNGQNFKPIDVQENLSIAVFCYASIRANPKSKDDRKIYQENGNLLAFSEVFNDRELLLADTPDTALLQVIRQFNPVVVVDESHNAKSELSVAMLKNVNPSFVLAMTATPTEKSNIISYVNARELKKENMVKLPVVVYHRPTRASVIHDAIKLRGVLEAKAKIELQDGGANIRPIVLFQAQPKTADDSATFDKIKEKLITIGIPAEEIAIKTANKDELKGVDLISPNCRIKYIITVNALKEGWDCPFAYILASLANKTSQTDVEQIVGRVLRQPYARKHSDKLLNMSFVLSCSEDFDGTVRSVVAGLNGAGFSASDYRIAEARDVVAEEKPVEVEQPELEPAKESDTSASDDDFADVPDVPIVSSGEISSSDEPIDSSIKELVDAANKRNDEYENEVKSDDDDLLGNMGVADMDRHKVMEEYASEIKALKIPQFTIEDDAGLFGGDDGKDLLTEARLMEDFSLVGKDASIGFNPTVTDAVQVDISEKGEVTPKSKALSRAELNYLAGQFDNKNAEERIKQIAETASKIIEKKNNVVTRQELDDYVTTAIRTLPPGVREALTPELINAFVDCVNNKIDSLGKEHRRQKFNQLISTNEVQCTPMYKLPSVIVPDRAITHLSKTLYSGEYDDMDGDEIDVINKIIAKDNVRWWHRIKDRKPGEFFINGYRKIYPDFMVMTEKGNTVLVEVKGPHLDGTDSQEKAEIGKAWADLAGTNYKYFMVFKRAGDGVPGSMSLDVFLNTLEKL